MSHRVVVSDEGQYSTWPDHQEPPAGWTATGFAGSEEECLDHIAQIWTELSPAVAPGAGWHWHQHHRDVQARAS